MNLKLIVNALALASIFATAACGGQGGSSGSGPEDRNAIALKKDWYGDSVQKVVYLDQNWTPEESLWYYFTSQGSELLSYLVFVNLEQKESTDLFIAPEHMAKFRYLPQKASPENPDGLPVGFVKQDTYLGLTCGACHTNQINYKGTGIRIDGAPAQANMVLFLESLTDALLATTKDSAKLERFAARIHKKKTGEKPRKEEIERASNKLMQTYHDLSNYNLRNHSRVPYGFARVDAVGRIFNQVLFAVGGPSNSIVPDAPASYPFLWDTSEHDWVQWIGLTPNAGPGALGRNTGEVIGVFGTVHVEKHTNDIEKARGYKSSVRSKNLVAYENLLRKLESPEWPEGIFGKIDAAKSQAGATLYQKNCASCHFVIDSRDAKRQIKAQMYDINLVKTDATEANNATSATGRTGILEGALSPAGGTYGKTAPVAVMLEDLVKGVLFHNLESTIDAIINAEKNGNGLEPDTKQGEYQQDTSSEPFNSLHAYKARPLDGIWATAPYLHNGSVPTLYDLLLPATERPKKFQTGRLEFDPQKVGFVSDPADPNAPFILDTSLKGNSNKGHSYGDKLSEEERLQLLEYLKTL